MVFFTYMPLNGNFPSYVIVEGFPEDLIISLSDLIQDEQIAKDLLPKYKKYFRTELRIQNVKPNEGYVIAEEAIEISSMKER